MTLTSFPEFAAQTPTKGTPVSAASQTNFANFVFVSEQNVETASHVQTEKYEQTLEIEGAANGLADLKVEEGEELEVDESYVDEVAIFPSDQPAESNQNLRLSIPADGLGNVRPSRLVADTSGLDMKNIARPTTMVAGGNDRTTVIADKDIVLVASADIKGPPRAQNSVQEGILNWRMSGELKQELVVSTSNFSQEVEVPREVLRQGPLSLAGGKTADMSLQARLEIVPSEVRPEDRAGPKNGTQLQLIDLNSRDIRLRQDVEKLEVRSYETRAGRQGKASDTSVPIEHLDLLSTSNRPSETPEKSLLSQLVNGLENDDNKTVLNLSEFDQLTPANDVARLSTSGPSLLGIDSKATMQQQMASAVSQQITVAISKNLDGVTELTLSPEELGRVSLSMKVVEGVISVSITTERPETQELIRRHIETLAQEFRSLGYQDVGFHFSEQSADGQSKDADEHQAQFANLKADAIETISEGERSQNAGLDLRL